MKKLSIFAALLLVLQLVIPFSTNVQAEEVEETFYYLALGDSLAAGVNENSEVGLGYADYITKAFLEESDLIHFNKGFAYPGYTTVDVLKDIQTNVTKPVYDLNGLSQSTATIREAIQQADLITLSIGANDILKNVKRSESGELTFDTANVLKSVQEITTNYDKIFTEIYTINPEVDILVMGLYNPFPHIKDLAVQAQLNTLVTTINNAIKNVVEGHEGIFSDVAEVVASDTAAYLPNPQNIHLSAAGYEEVANNMMADYFLTYFEDIEDILEDILTEQEDYFTDLSDHWGKNYIHIAYESGIVKGYEDGTFKPNVNMTRVQVLSVISRAFELTATKQAPFKDISNYDSQTQTEIAAAFEAGLVNENGGYFNPKEEITRAQLALMLMRLSNHLVGEEYVPTAIAPFKDIVKLNKETQVAITYLYDYGIAEGTSATTFSPFNKVTRAQLAKIIVTALSEE